MPFTNHQGCAIHRRRICSDLDGQPGQRIGITLYFVAVQKTIDHRDINTACPMLQTQFMHDKNIRVQNMFGQYFFDDRLADVPVSGSHL